MLSYLDDIYHEWKLDYKYRVYEKELSLVTPIKHVYNLYSRLSSSIGAIQLKYTLTSFNCDPVHMGQDILPIHLAWQQLAI